ncbi:large subunit GTPase 1, partial [Bonamia ostreae]
LCDCPGLVFPSLSNSRAELICSGIISVEHSKNLFESVELITRRVPTHYFLKVYKGLTLPVNEEFVSCQRVLSTLSTQKGWLTACSQPNLSKSARQIIKDYLSGDLLFCFAPPDLGEEELQDFYKIEKKGLKEELGMRKETPLLLEKEKVFDERLGGSKKKHFRRTREFRRKERKEMNSQKRSVKILT